MAKNKSETVTVADETFTGEPDQDNAPAVVSVEVAALKAQLAAKDAQLERLGVGPGMDEGIRWRVKMGATHEQAIECERRQRAHDAVLADKTPMTDGERNERLIKAASL